MQVVAPSGSSGNHYQKTSRVIATGSTDATTTATGTATATGFETATATAT